ncbi:ABC transporter substrate-binding protein [Microvirga sp. VF16]|uniref:ABC transporter substrate-binding protein n=1 Tax=Microvirga sp. VF16 TaxID=2807101 RepID=UPI00193D13B1|nr:ABC transporter substrate-binding protein [Microvirga sp. VF16]QRM33149.1 ABC transporter substrate-binding protein [Microvirga sp. VF16]
MLRNLIAALVATVSTVLVTVSPAQAQARNPLKVALTTWVGYGLLHLADRKGLFKANGADVELITVQDKPSTAAAIATGRLDGWATTVDTFIFYNAQKIGAKQVLAVDFSKGGEGIISTNDVKDVKDLKGHSIGAEEGSSTYFFLLNVLADAGLKVSDVKLQNMRAGDAGAAFVAGRLDAAATWDPWLSQAGKRSGGRVLVDTKAKPGLIVDTVAFRADVLEKRPTDVAGVIKGYFAAYDYWKANPEESNKIMAEALGTKIEDFNSSLAGLEFVSREANKQYFGTPSTPGEIAGVITRGIEFYRNLGLVKDAMDPKSVVDAAPLNNVLKN